MVSGEMAGFTLLEEWGENAGFQLLKFSGGSTGEYLFLGDDLLMPRMQGMNVFNLENPDAPQLLRCSQARPDGSPINVGSGILVC